MPRVAPAAARRAARARRVRGRRARGSRRPGRRRRHASAGRAQRPARPDRALRAACRLGRAAERRIVQLAEIERASGRGTERMLRVARTIADLAGSAVVAETHLDEAAWYRSADMRLAAVEAR